MFLICKYDGINWNTIEIFKIFNEYIDLENYLNKNYKLEISLIKIDLYSNFYNSEINYNGQFMIIFNLNDRNNDYYNLNLNIFINKLYTKYKNNLIKMKLKSLK